jgi:hypothetical protein
MKHRVIIIGMGLLVCSTLVRAESRMLDCHITRESWSGRYVKVKTPRMKFAFDEHAQRLAILSPPNWAGKLIDVTIAPAFISGNFAGWRFTINRKTGALQIQGVTIEKLVVYEGTCS